MTFQIYGYAGCTTVKRAVEWADTNDLSPQYTHFNKLDDLRGALEKWVEAAGIDSVFNARAQTFKKLDEAERSAITKNTGTMIDAMANEPRFIKRPVGTDGTSVLTGFDAAEWEKTFA